MGLNVAQNLIAAHLVDGEVVRGTDTLSPTSIVTGRSWRARRHGTP
jgi:hypothetical protein